MNLPPKQPEDKAESQEMPLAKAARTRRQHLLSMRTTELAQTPSLGEILLPFLFAAMETCWIDAIFIGLADIGLFESQAPLMPLWAPFVLIIGSQWILSLLERRAASTSSGDKDDTQTTIPGSWLLTLFISLTTLFIIWLTIYTPTGFFLNPGWLLALLNDTLSLNLRAYHIFFIVALALYFCWRGMRLLSREYEPSQVFGTLRLGMGIIVVVILVHADQASGGGVRSDDFILLLLVPVFLFLSLAAHALARVTFVRHTHPVGLEGDISVHERSILFTIGIVGVILLLTAVLVDTFASPTIPADIQPILNVLGQAYGWLVGILAAVIVILITPIFWLFDLLINLLHSLFPSHGQQIPPHAGAPRSSISLPPHTIAIPLIVPFVKILFPVLLVVVAILFIRWIMRRRQRVRIIANRRVEELRESLWSWTLFWAQLKALLLSLFRRFFPQRAIPEEGQASTEAIEIEPTARNIREIYRALLKRAAARGYPRRKDETPYEFRQRLDEKTSLAEPQLTVVTEAYTATRYGAIVPGEAAVAHIQQEWAALEQKWRETRS
ncbi:MAG TPA: DUF4129 domain-containing protein [Ktedonobacteraceae bacterium]|nr:DUF4129 domain-containing protein [Ktedonobacteraceae bacterium]